MYRSLKTISMIAITLTTMGVLSSCSSQSGTSSNTSTYSSPRASISETPGTSSQENQTSSSTSLASDPDSSCGKIISEKADQYAGISLPRWKNASYAQRCGYARRMICEQYNGSGSSDVTAKVVQELGGTSSTKDLQEGSAIISFSIQTVCPAQYPQYLRDIQNDLSQ